LIAINSLHTLATSVGFGTSGVRALVADLAPSVVWAYTQAFLGHLRQSGQYSGKACVVAWDLRPSSPAIAAAVGAAAAAQGFDVEWAGTVPTPALALRSLALACPGIMVTGSHIPFDRNGIKFYTPTGEILKADEAAIASWAFSELPAPDSIAASIQAAAQSSQRSLSLPSATQLAYQQRYTQLLPPNALEGLRVGVYQHSAVGRDLLAQILQQLGATVVALARSEQFVPIDTEAVSPQDEAQAAQWCQAHELHAVVSTDGDGDRPWVCDERGQFMRGDVLCTLVAQWLGASTVVTPVSSNTALERSAWFGITERTRIGSPYVIEAMQTLAGQGRAGIVGFEANGGFLLQSSLRDLSSLPTRDSTLPIVAILALSCQLGLPVSALPAQLPARFTQSGRIQGVPTADSQALLKRLALHPADLAEFLSFTGSAPTQIDTTDGLRTTLANGDVVHLRPSGNAPELRCYTEASSPEQAQQLLQQTLAALQQHLTQLSSTQPA
jgi:phosphomannomutase